MPRVPRSTSRVRANSFVERRRMREAASSAAGTASTASVGSSPSTTSFSTSGTATFASFAATRNASASDTRQRYSQRYGKSIPSTRQSLRRAGASGARPVLGFAMGGADSKAAGPAAPLDGQGALFLSFKRSFEIETDHERARPEAPERDPDPYPRRRRRAVHAARLRERLDADVDGQGGRQPRRGQLSLRLQGRAGRGGVPAAARSDERRATRGARAPGAGGRRQSAQAGSDHSRLHLREPAHD